MPSPWVGENFGGGGTGAIHPDLPDRIRREIDYVERKAGVTVECAAVDEVVRRADEGRWRLLSSGPTPTFLHMLRPASKPS